MTSFAFIVAGLFGGWELLLMILVLLTLIGARWWSELKRGKGTDPGEAVAGAWKGLIVWVAEGFGVGRIPYGPGTFGSLAGLAWLALLVQTGSLAGFFIGLGIGLAYSVLICEAAERITGQKDPGSVVLDEIVAVPICFIPWLLSEHARHHTMPDAGYFFGAGTWWLTLLLFGLFRLFDIWKPWPIRPSQNLPGGWGVTIDDVLAALAVAALSLLAVK